MAVIFFFLTNINWYLNLNFRDTPTAIEKKKLGREIDSLKLRSSFRILYGFENRFSNVCTINRDN